MFVKRLVCIILIGTLLIPMIGKIDDVHAVESSDVRAAADNLFQLMDPSAKETAKIYSLYKSGNYNEALRAYRDYFIDKVRKIDYGYFHQDNIMIYGAWTDQAKLLTGEWTMQDYKNAYPTRKEPVLPAEELIGDPAKDLGDYNWVETWDATANYSTIPTSEMMTRFLVGQYYVSEKKIYMDKFMQLISHYCVNGKRQAEEFLASKTAAQKDNGVYWKIDAQCALSTGDRLINLIQCLAAFSKFLTLNKEITKGYRDLLRPVTGDVPAEKYDYMDPVKLAQICTSLIKDHVPYLYDCYMVKMRNAAPNQRNNGLKALIFACAAFDEFIPTRGVADEVNKEYETSLWNVMHKDGGFLEQSFNYNEGEYETRVEMYNFLKSLNKESELTENLSQSVTLWERLVEGYSDPVGKLPQIGNLDNRGVDAIWKDDKAAQDLKSGLKEDDKGYTSVYFPISGYAAMRSGWDMLQDMYLGFVNARKSNGHFSSNVNSVWITAFGRPMILSGACPWYGKSFAPESALDEYDKLNYYFDENSSLKNSTVLVNGMSQTSTNKDNQVFKVSPQTPVDARWLSSDNFDYIEGLWDGGYFKTAAREWNVKDLSVIHKRQVAFVKDAGMFVILDTMNQSNKHVNEYRQIWGFSEYMDNSIYNGYTNEQVVVDEQNHMVKTQDQTGPNLWLLQFSTAVPQYHKYYGDRETDLGVYLGWGGPAYNKEIGRIPKVDLHVAWSNKSNEASSQMITVAYPSKDISQPYISKTDLSDNEKGISAFEIKVNENKTVKFFSSPEVKTFEADGFKTNAKNFLITFNKASGVYTGLILDGEDFYIGNQLVKDSKGSYEFTIKSGEFLKNSEIKVPTSFAWIGSGDSRQPRYDFLSDQEVDGIIKQTEGMEKKLRLVRYSDLSYLQSYVEKCMVSIKENILSSRDFAENGKKKELSDNINLFTEKLTAMLEYYDDKAINDMAVKNYSSIFKVLSENISKDTDVNSINMFVKIANAVNGKFDHLKVSDESLKTEFASSYKNLIETASKYVQ